MKYHFLLIIFFPFFSSAQSNDQLLNGTWVKAKAQMKDGSRIVDHNYCGMDFMKYNFTADGFVDMGNDVLFEGFKTQYKVGKDSLQIGGTLYNMIGLTKDTLKLSFFVMGADDQQLPVYYFVKTQGQNSVGKPTYDAVLKDSVYQATNQFFPGSKGRFTNLMYAISAIKYPKGTLKVSFIVDKKGHVKNYTILQADSVPNSFAKSVGSAFSSLSWQPARKNYVPVNTLVQVTLKTDYGTFQGTPNVNTLSIEYPFLPESPYGKIDKDEAEAGRQYFQNAINQVNSHNYEKALEFLNKCIEIDSVDVSAYYLRAMVNIQLQKNKEACKDWSILAGLGQKKAVENLAKFCKN